MTSKAPIPGALVEPLGPDEIARRLDGRHGPPPPWRRWNLVDLRRRRLALLLREEVADARERGDETLVEVLGPVADAIEALVVEQGDRHA